MDELTKDYYKESLETFLAALRALEEVSEVFSDLACSFDLDGVEENGIGVVLDEAGAWITGSEYQSLHYARRTLESLVGRSYSRSRR